MPGINRRLMNWSISICRDSFPIWNIRKGKRNSVLAINEGFMCNLTLRNLFDFKIENDEENDGYRLARAFVEAGIKVPQEIFIALFAKLYKIDAPDHKN